MRSDAELIIESLDETARFGEIFDRHAEVVFRYLARRIGPDDASDLLADVFVAAFEARSRYDSDFSTALPWLYGIASNLLRKHFRRRAGELRMLDRLVAQSEPDDHVDAVADVIDARVQVRAMAKLLDELPPGERDVTVNVQLGGVLMTTGRALVPVFLACIGAAVITAGVQSGFRLTPNALTFNFDRLDISAGFARVFSRSALVRTGIDVLKLLAIGSVLYMGARALLADPMFSVPVEAAYLGQFMRLAAMTFLGRIILALSVAVALSYGYERFKTSQELMMTRQEVKEERRNANGNVFTKVAMRRMARRLMQKQMLSAVAMADVVITNPTHYAVALKYERSKDRAPVVLAKGENRFAQRLKEIAAENGVPMIENKPVARVLFSMAKVGETIPPDLYQAVAEILAVVYRTHRYYFHRLKARRVEASI